MGKVNSKISKSAIRNSFRRKKKGEKKEKEGKVESTNEQEKVNGVNGAAVADPVPQDVKAEETPAAKPESPAAEETPTTDSDAPKAESPALAAVSVTVDASTTEGETSAVESDVPAEKTMSEDDAAAKIQAIVRGNKAREEVKAMRSTTEATVEESKPEETPAEPAAVAAAEVPAEEPAKEEEAKPAEEEESTPEEQEAAALKIQATFRGIKARKEVEAMKTESTAEITDAPETAETPADPPAAEN